MDTLNPNGQPNEDNKMSVYLEDRDGQWITGYVDNDFARGHAVPDDASVPFRRPTIGSQRSVFGQVGRWCMAPLDKVLPWRDSESVTALKPVYFGWFKRLQRLVDPSFRGRFHFLSVPTGQCHCHDNGWRHPPHSAASSWRSCIDCGDSG